MKNPDQKFIARNPLVGFTIALLVVLGIVAAFTASAKTTLPLDPNGGPWRNQQPNAACPAGDVCAEWPSPAYEVTHVCCVDAIYPGGSNGCENLLEIRPTFEILPTVDPI